MTGPNYARPCLLQGRKIIAEVFRVNPATVTQWVREGAPIWREGNMWQVDYQSLVSWFEVNRKIILGRNDVFDTQRKQD